MSTIKYNKVYNFDLTSQGKFGTLSDSEFNEILKDGRVASHFLEAQLEKWFPSLKHVKGCKGYDHVDRENTDQKYDAKNFTSHGCKFMPSSMLGTGRKFNEEKFIEKANSMDYIICDILEYPKVRVIFKKGGMLAEQFPDGKISKTKRGLLFNE